MGKIVIVSCVFPPEPVVSARLSFDIAHKIHQNEKEVVVISPRPSRPQNYPFGDERLQLPYKNIVLDSYVCPQSHLLGRFRESFSFGKATYEYIYHNYHEIDLIYANTWPLFAQLFLAKAARKYRIPYYIHVQDVYPESYCHKLPWILGTILFRLFVPIDKYVLRNASGVFAISPSMRSYLSESRQIDDSRILLVRNWQNDETYGTFVPIVSNNNTINVMYLGSINPTANVSLIIRAISQLNKNRFHLSIIGNGSEKRNCQELAKQLGLDVTFGSVNSDEVAEKQREASILVLCLKKGVAKTATPSKLTAYMLTGRPIVVSVDLDSDCANIIREAGCGLVVEPENEDSLRDAIYYLSSKGLDELNRLGQAANKYAMRFLSRESNLQIIVDKLLS